MQKKKKNGKTLARDEAKAMEDPVQFWCGFRLLSLKLQNKNIDIGGGCANQAHY